MRVIYNEDFDEAAEATLIAAAAAEDQQRGGLFQCLATCSGAALPRPPRFVNYCLMFPNMYVEQAMLFRLLLLLLSSSFTSLRIYHPETLHLLGAIWTSCDAVAAAAAKCDADSPFVLV
jgi:hypothetical protein